ncbi:hypothetical protein POPTR_017G056201v4 [Populus trichocarpa]|uniref:Uncharacterized protein n=1 Tax=Populus trichocarpa TaxID=3694 RepID=A0ACC0RPI1_POPTR|nr:hypothetical protein POPTR_017G056201v4 [Populus trichocarpa]
MEDIRDLRDEFSGRLKNVPDHVLARLKATLEGHCDLIHGFNVFLPPSHRFSVVDDDEDDDSEAAEGHSDLFRCIVPLCGDDADLLECFYRVMRACEAPSSVASRSPDSRDKDVKNSGAVLIKAGEERKKQHPEKIEVAQGNDKERNFVRGFAVKPGDHDPSTSPLEIKSNESEKIMLECEDNRYEMDMLISWFSSAVEYAEELEKGIDDNEMEKGNRNFYGVLNVYMVIRVLRYFTY